MDQLRTLFYFMSLFLTRIELTVAGIRTRNPVQAKWRLFSLDLHMWSDGIGSSKIA